MTNTHTHTSKKRTALIATLCAIGGAAVCAAIAIPVMLTQCNSKSPSYTVTTNNAILSNKGDQIEIDITTKGKAPDYCALQVDETYAEYFDSNDVSYCMQLVSGDQRSSWRSEPNQAETYFHKGQAKFTITLTSDLPPDMDTTMMGYNIAFWRENSDKTGTPFVYEQESYSSHFVVLSSTSVTTKDEVSGMSVIYSQLSLASQTAQSFASWLTTNSPLKNLLPTAQQKIDVSIATNSEQIMEQLHKYDNAASISAIFLSDLFNSGKSFTGARWAALRMNILKISATTAVSNVGVDTQKFDISFQQQGQGAIYNGELMNDIFMTNDNNISPSDWTITWSTWLHDEYHQFSGTHTFTDKGDQNGTLTGMYFGGITTDAITELKAIYNGVVSAWPSSWSSY